MNLAKTLIFTIIVPGSATIGIPYLLLSAAKDWPSYDLGPFRFLGVLLIVVGTVFYVWCAWEFSFTGKGTPAIWDPPTKLVSHGMYQLVRNPMYVGIELILFGEAILFQSWILIGYAAVFGFSSHIFVVYFEEPGLQARFGAVYEEYCRIVPRWIPSRTPRLKTH